MMQLYEVIVGVFSAGVSEILLIYIYWHTFAVHSSGLYAEASLMTEMRLVREAASMMGTLEMGTLESSINFNGKNSKQFHLNQLQEKTAHSLPSIHIDVKF